MTPTLRKKIMTLLDNLMGRGGRVGSLYIKTFRCQMPLGLCLPSPEKPILGWNS